MFPILFIFVEKVNVVQCVFAQYNITVLFQNTCPHSRVQEQFLLDLEEEGVSEDSQ